MDLCSAAATSSVVEAVRASELSHVKVIVGGAPVTPEFAAWVLERNFDAFGEWRDIARGMGIGQESKDWTFLTRIQLGLYSVLGALRATGDWRAVHDELRNSDPAPTEVGRQHQAWKAART